MDYSGISGASMEGRSLERKSTMIGESEVANAGVKSLGAIQSAGYQADAIRAQGEAQGQASMASGLASGISSLAGGFGSLGGSTSGSKSYGGYGGKYDGTAPTLLLVDGMALT